MGQNIQVKIGENGEVVELPLKRYEELLNYEILFQTNAIVPIDEYLYLKDTEKELLKLYKNKHGYDIIGIKAKSRPLL